MSLNLLSYGATEIEWNAALSLLSLLPHLLSSKVLLRPGFQMFLWLTSTEGIAGSISRIPWQTQNPELKLSTSTLSPLIHPSCKESYHFLQVLAGPQRQFLTSRGSLLFSVVSPAVQQPLSCLELPWLYLCIWWSQHFECFFIWLNVKSISLFECFFCFYRCFCPFGQQRQQNSTPSLLPSPHFFL